MDEQRAQQGSYLLCSQGATLYTALYGCQGLSSLRIPVAQASPTTGALWVIKFAQCRRAFLSSINLNPLSRSAAICEIEAEGNPQLCLIPLNFFVGFFFCRNCLVGADCHVKISDFSVHRPCYAADYHSVQEAGKQLLLPLRWVPWEVYIMVRSEQ